MWDRVVEFRCRLVKFIKPPIENLNWDHLLAVLLRTFTYTYTGCDEVRNRGARRFPTTRIRHPLAS
jgi:hypothetical protein